MGAQHHLVAPTQMIAQPQNPPLITVTSPEDVTDEVREPGEPRSIEEDGEVEDEEDGDVEEEERTVELYANVENFNENLTDLLEEDIEAAKRRIWTLLSFKLFNRKRHKTKSNGQPYKRYFTYVSIFKNKVY